MKTEDTVEYNSLRWVKKELDLILQEAQTALSAYIDEPDEADRLQECIEHLHMVQGTLQMVELYGAAQLAEEMEVLATAVLKGELEKTDDAYDVLMRSMLQLPDYLESLQAGSKDVPLVLLPLLNDLRAARKASLLSENVLFFPDIDNASNEEKITGVEAGQLQALAKKLRPHLQIGLLGWFKAEKVTASLKRILAVLSELEKKSSDRSTQRLWSVSAALIEALLHEGLDSSVSVKMLLGQVDRSIKQLIDKGDEVFSKAIPNELLKNTLYYVARASCETPRVQNTKQVYRLAELLPGDKELEEARSGLGGLNTELLRTVSQGIREDLLEVKDILEIFVHSEDRDAGKLASLPELLNKIADTLAMLGLGHPREEVMQAKEKVQKFVSAEKNVSDDEVMGIAGVLLAVESQLNNLIANRSTSDSEKQHKRVGDFEDMPEAEYQEVLSAVMREALRDFSDARQSILGFLDKPSDKSFLEIILKRLEDVSGAMFMLPIQKLEIQIESLKTYITKVLLMAGQVPEQKTQDDIADVVTSIEYYLESLQEGRPDIEISLTAGNAAASRLNDISEGYEYVEEAPAAVEEPVVEKTAAEPPVVKVEPQLAVATEKSGVKPAAEAEKTVETSTRQRYVILGDDADEEILEIFIEEALEELASLNEQVPNWANDLKNEEALMTIRRSFHTLKGSGRLIGALLIGEFAWSFESLLNRIIEKSRPADQDVFDILGEALAVLPQLIEQLKGNREPIYNIYELIDRAEAMGQWHKPDNKEVAAKKEADAEKKLQTDVESTEIEFESVDECIVEEPEELLEIEDPDELPLQLDDELSLELMAEGLDDDFDIDLTDDLEALQIAISPDDESLDDDALVLGFGENEILDLADDDSISFDEPEIELEIEDSGVALEPAQDIDFESDDILLDDDEFMDPVLFEIFKKESDSHLQQINKLLLRHVQGEEALIASDDLYRALHTLYGSAKTAEVAEIAELSGALEQYIKIVQDQDDPTINDDGVKLVGDVAHSVAAMLDGLLEKDRHQQSDQVLLERIKLQTRQRIEKAAEKGSNESVAEASVSDSLVSYSDVDDELVDIFLEEAEELIDSCENSLQRWNANNSDTECVNDLQRHLHTLKGGARMADLAPVGDLTHALESLIVSVSEGKVAFSKELSNALHDSMDRLSDLLAKVKKREPITSTENLVRRLDSIRKGESVTKKNEDIPAGAAEEPEPALLAEDELVLVDDEDVVDLAPAALIDDDDSFLDLDDVLTEPEVAIERVEDDEPGVAEKSGLILEKEYKPEPQDDASTKGGIAQEQVRVRSDLLNSLVNNASEVSVYHARMGQQISDFSFNLSEMEQTVVRLREQLRKLSIETEAQILSRYEKEVDQYGEDFDPLEMDRFSNMQQISRSLQETVGDIGSIKDILSESVRDAETLLLQESRVSTELQEGLMRTRMVHFGGLTSRLRRIVRQTARELGKDVELEIVGETSEVDRTVLDRIIAPLEHMLRNAVSHGIEIPKERLLANKKETGLIKIIVDREGGDVVIHVNDDGRGIDIGAVRSRATARGLLDPASKLSDHDVLQFIMEPGFSTAEKVTQISGRGVGMDVVDSEIKQLGGLLEIDTVQGKGTKFTIRLPLTLAINHALLVAVNEDVYAVPLNSIEGVVRLSGIELQQFYDSEDSSYDFAGSSYDLRHLGFLLTGQQPDYSRSGQLFPVLLARVGDQHMAIHVDDLLGRREVVVKPVGPQISTVRGISGATILGDGRVVLILEMNAVVLGDSLFHVGRTEEQPAEAEPERELVVMVVDDSITIRKVTERMLSRHGIRVITAKDGVDALAQLQEVVPDVMLLDIEMPRMDGYEVATHIRNDKLLKDLPIIMITSRSGSKHRDKAMAIGVNKYLGKPYQEDELMENINELIG